MAITLGNEVLIAERADLVRGRRVGLITNPSGVNARLEATTDALLRAGIRLAGTDRVRQAIDAGAGAEEIVASFEPDIRAFAEMREAYLMYA